MEAQKVITLQQEIVIDNVHDKHVFSNNNKSIGIYRKSMKKAIKTIGNHLKERNTPFTGTSISVIKKKIDNIELEENTKGKSLDYVLDELKDIYLDDCIHFHNP